jgi:hypothetical protein
LFDDLSADQWIDRLAAFLREWGVPEDTSFKVFSADWVEGDQPQQVFVFGA